MSHPQLFFSLRLLKMDAIYHEKQQGQLCAQHCLNNLLQDNVFDAVALSDIARELDKAEQSHLADVRQGLSKEIDSQGNQSLFRERAWRQHPSANMDDSGFFSIQVISKALLTFGLELVPLSSQRMKHVIEDPTTQHAFICNHDLHWFTVRKFGYQWFNLNSFKDSPELITDTYLSLFLTQLQMEGYSIFVVVGRLPQCEAHQLLTLAPVQLPSSTKHSSHGSQVQHKPHQRMDSEEHYQMELAIAMSASLADSEELPSN